MRCQKLLVQTDLESFVEDQVLVEVGSLFLSTKCLL